MENSIRTVFVFEATDEARQKETALKNANAHPLGLANVCYHRYGYTCNNECYTISLKDGDSSESEEIDTKV